MDKQIIAALEIADHEVRLLVGQFYNSRLNILKVERVPHLGIKGYSIMSESLVIESIKKAIENASRNLGVVISEVLLLVPGVHMKRFNKQLRVPITGRISENDIKRAYRELLNISAPEDYVLTNVVISKFFVNGSSTRKLPLNEKCDSLTIEADCYLGKTSVIFPYVECVEKSGLKIIDIVLDDIGYAKEASLFEASIDKPIIALTFSEKITKLSLFDKGVLLSNDYQDFGFDVFMGKLKSELKLPGDVVNRLLYYNVDLNNHYPSDDPIFIWSVNSISSTISEKDILDAVAEDIKLFVDDLVDRCEPIFQNLGKPRFILSGEAAEVRGIDTKIKAIAETDANIYRSNTFGVKDLGLTSVLGAFYFYKDQSIFREVSKSSINEEEFKRIILKEEKDEDDSITQKLKNMFFER